VAITRTRTRYTKIPVSRAIRPSGIGEPGQPFTNAANSARRRRADHRRKIATIDQVISAGAGGMATNTVGDQRAIITPTRPSGPGTSSARDHQPAPRRASPARPAMRTTPNPDGLEPPDLWVMPDRFRSRRTGKPRAEHLPHPRVTCHGLCSAATPLPAKDAHMDTVATLLRPWPGLPATVAEASTAVTSCLKQYQNILLCQENRSSLWRPAPVRTTHGHTASRHAPRTRRTTASRHPAAGTDAGG